MSGFDQFLSERLAEIDQQHLRRRLRVVSSPQSSRVMIEGRELLHFSSNDYLGLANHQALKMAAVEAIEQCGVGAGASRLISGSHAAHHELEDLLARFKGTEAALVFSSGYVTAIGTITALLSREDFVVMDKLVHASIIDAARLSGATMRIFAHNDPNDLEAILKSCQARRGPGSKVLIITESLFSMDGDLAPLPELVRLKEQHDAWLMVDEAHATGLFGPQRRGYIEETGLSDRVEIQMGTLGKALGSTGGFICGSRKLVDYLTNKARPFIFSTAANPMASRAAAAALRTIGSQEGADLRDRLWRNIAAFTSAVSPIVPIILGAETTALDAAERLLKQGIFVPAIRFPTVARNKARLRISFSAAHSPDDVSRLKVALEEIMETLPTRPAAPA